MFVWLTVAPGDGSYLEHRLSKALIRKIPSKLQKAGRSLCWGWRWGEMRVNLCYCGNVHSRYLWHLLSSPQHLGHQNSLFLKLEWCPCLFCQNSSHPLRYKWEMHPLRSFSWLCLPAVNSLLQYRQNTPLGSVEMLQIPCTVLSSILNMRSLSYNYFFLSMTLTQR